MSIAGFRAVALAAVIAAARAADAESLTTVVDTSASTPVAAPTPAAA